MAKLTLLQMTQQILSNLDGDEVNSISDTVESEQVAQVIQQCYFDIVDEHDLPSNGELINLTGLGDTSKPTHMQIPESVQQLEWIKYDTRAATDDSYAYTNMQYKTPDEFVSLVNSRDRNDTDNLVVMHNADTPLVISQISSPTFWTSFDDEYVVFDAYNQTVDSTLQTSKTICHGYLRPEFILDDDTIPDLPENLFRYLQIQAEATCFANFKQEVNQKTEQKERRMRIRSQRNKWREARMDHNDVNFGRK